MAFGRPRRDGDKILDEASDKLWLVFSGRRHHVTNNEVFRSLFRENVAIERSTNGTLKEIKQGEDLIYGTSLVRSSNDGMIHLLAVHPTRVFRHPIPSSDVFDKYGFEYGACRVLPDEIFRKIGVGPKIA